MLTIEKSFSKQSSILGSEKEEVSITESESKKEKRFLQTNLAVLQKKNKSLFSYKKAMEEILPKIVEEQSLEKRREIVASGQITDLVKKIEL